MAAVHQHTEEEMIFKWIGSQMASVLFFQRHLHIWRNSLPNTLSFTRAGTIMKGKMKRKSSSRDQRADNCLCCPLERILRVENISSHLQERLATECWLSHKRLPIHSSVHFSKEISVLHVLQVSFTEQPLSNILPLLSLSLSWSGCFVPG